MTGSVAPVASTAFNRQGRTICGFRLDCDRAPRLPEIVSIRNAGGSKSPHARLDSIARASWHPSIRSVKLPSSAAGYSTLTLKKPCGQRRSPPKKVALSNGPERESKSTTI
jgi:hypothetical protein